MTSVVLLTALIEERILAKSSFTGFLRILVCGSNKKKRLQAFGEHPLVFRAFRGWTEI